MTGKEALERLFSGYISSKCYGINYEQDDKDYNTIKQDLDLLNYLIKLAETKKGKIVIEIDKETNFETYTRLKEVLNNDK